MTTLKEDSIQSQIIQAAQQLFQVYGLQKVTMDDVAAEIGKRRSSLYYYYKNKEEILDAAIAVELREIFSEIAQAVEQAATVEEKIVAYCITRLTISHTRRMIHNMLDNGTANDPDYKKVKLAMHDGFRQMEIPLLKNIFTYGIETGTLTEIDEQQQEVLIVVILSSIQGFKKEMILKKSIDPVKPAVAMLAKLVAESFKK